MHDHKLFFLEIADLNKKTGILLIKGRYFYSSKDEDLVLKVIFWILDYIIPYSNESVICRLIVLNSKILILFFFTYSCYLILHKKIKTVAIVFKLNIRLAKGLVVQRVNKIKVLIKS